jgi:DNA topoisomerase-1
VGVIREIQMIVKNETSCILCVRKAIHEEFCEFHFEALESLRTHFQVWRSSYGEITWYDYLNRLQEIKHTGKWVKDVIEIELKKLKKE